MILNVLHTLSGVLILLFFFAKVLMHYYLDYKRGYSINFTSILLTPSAYFLRYKANVAKNLVRLKILCNSFLALTILALILNIAFGVLIYFK